MSVHDSSCVGHEGSIKCGVCVTWSPVSRSTAPCLYCSHMQESLWQGSLQLLLFFLQSCHDSYRQTIKLLISRDQGYKMIMSSIFARGNPCQQSKNSIAPLHCIRHTPAQHQPHNLCHVDIVTFVQQRAGLGQRRRRKSWGEIKSFLNVKFLF